MLFKRCCRGAWFACLLLWLIVSQASGDDVSNDALEFFERRVRPILAEHCHKCHGPDEQNGSLRLDSRDSILSGGDLGAAIHPGAPDDSLILRAISYEDKNLQMPPDGKLSDDSIGTLRQWISTGAVWPESSSTPASDTGANHEFSISDEDREHWAFQPIQRTAIPAMEQANPPVNPIDAFVLSRLKVHDLNQNEPASKREFIRRATFDLLGVPPTPEQIEEFVSDSSPHAYEQLIDRLLASPHYGERWARHWLDVVRYAQTDGYQNDREKPDAWRYRDYVVRAFNEDKPFDQFIVEQLAGDELPDATHDSVIATGFLRLGPWNNEPLDEQSGLAEEYDEMVRTTTEAFLGMTVGCARCHDHKSDPIPQSDYYRLVACFRNVKSYGARVDHITFQYDPKHASMPLFSAAQMAAWREMRDEIKELKEQDLDPAERESKLAAIKKAFCEQEVQSALSARETEGPPPPTYINVRGNPMARGAEVTPGALTILESTVQPFNIETAETELWNDYRQSLADWGVQPPIGRRLALARWIVSDSNPLTARVAVNRIWQHHFGRAIVASTSDFGEMGQGPTHPELLDWLATELIQQGWRMKPLHRLIMLSKTYRQSSQIGNPVAEKVDVANTLLWRQNMRRLDAESLRDAILFVNGRLNTKIGGPSFYPQQSAEVMAASQVKLGKGWKESTSDDRARRSIYIYIKRNLAVPLMEALDVPNPDKAEPARAVTTVAPQALMLLNSSFADEEADAMARRLQRECDCRVESRIDRGLELAIGRCGTSHEIDVLTRLFDEHQQSFAAAGDTPESAEFKALRNICKVIFNLNEFAYID